MLDENKNYWLYIAPHVYCRIEGSEAILYNTKNGQIIKGHEFHHSIFKSNEPCAYEMTKEKGGVVIDRWDGGYSIGNTLATYLHTHFYNNLDCIANFLEKGNK